jgi:predicted nuclease with TOPRIM domain
MTTQIPENPGNNDIREALTELREGLMQLKDEVSQLNHKVDKLDDRVEKLDDRVEKLDYKFDVYQKGTDGMVRMATTIIIATASVVIFSGLTPAFSAFVTSLITGNAG